jgi:hypothetical protein
MDQNLLLVAACVAIDLIIEMRYKFRMLGVKSEYGKRDIVGWRQMCL